MPDPQSDGLVDRPGRPLRWASIALLLFAVVAALLAWSGYTGRIASAVHDVELRARGAAADVDRYAQSQLYTLYGIATMPAIRDGDLAAMVEYLDTVDPTQLGLDAGISYVDPDGFMRARSGGYRGPAIDFRDREHIVRALATRQPAVSSGIVGAVNRVPIIGFVVPIIDTDGTFRGLIGSGVRLNELSIGADELRYAGGTRVVIVDALGQIIAGAQPVESLEPVAAGFPLDQVRALQAGALESATGPYGDPDHMVGYATAPRAGWTVLVQAPASTVVTPARIALAFQLLAIAIGVVIAIVLLGWAGRRLERAAAAEQRTLAELKVAVATLEQRQALSDAFVGVMSHELRTPVTTIYGGLELLRRNPGRADAAELVEDIAEEADRLKRITEDLLVLSRAEHGAVTVHAEPVLVQRLLPLVVEDVRRRFPRARIEEELPVGLPAVAGDAGALRQVLGNLLSNAAKYGAGAPVRVTGAADEATVRITVEDHGPGVAAGEAEHLFDLFYRAPSNQKRASGTGIGLFVVRELVRAMGGEVRSEPVEPHGLRFVVTLPLLSPDAAAVDDDRLVAVPARA